MKIEDIKDEERQNQTTYFYQGIQTNAINVMWSIPSIKYATLIRDLFSECVKDDGEFDWLLYSIYKKVLIFKNYTDLELPDEVDAAYDKLSEVGLLTDITGIGLIFDESSQIAEIDKIIEKLIKYKNTKFDNLCENLSNLINSVENKLKDVDFSEINEVLNSKDKINKIVDLADVLSEKSKK